MRVPNPKGLPTATTVRRILQITDRVNGWQKPQHPPQHHRHEEQFRRRTTEIENRAGPSVFIADAKVEGSRTQAAHLRHVDWSVCNELACVMHACLLGRSAAWSFPHWAAQ